MNTKISSPSQFQNMISEFCDKRVKPHVPDEILNKISPYLNDLIVNYRKPPMRRSQIDWLSLASESRMDFEFTDKLKTIIRPALESIIRWVDNGAPQADQIVPKRKTKDRRTAVRMSKPDRAPVLASGKTSVRPKPSAAVSRVLIFFPA